MTLRWQHKEPRLAPPLMPDAVVRRADQIKSRPPPASLGSLISATNVAVSATSTNGGPEHRTSPAHRTADSTLSHVGRGLVRGLPGLDYGRVSREATLKAGGNRDQTDAFLPSWSDLNHSPRVSPGLVRPSLRRMNGRRVKPHYVFGNDARTPFYPSGYPWQCIGRIFVWTDASNPNWSWSGTAALVTHNTILTAGHVAPWGSSSWMALFVPAYYNGSSTLGSGVLSYAQSFWGYNTGDQVSAWDYCVMKLYDPLGDQLGWMGTKTYDDGWNDGNYWTLVGYPGAVANAEQPSSQGAISFHDTDGDGDAEELETDNGDSSPGDSGGPFFAWWNDGWPYIVGVDSGEEEEYQFPFSTQDNNIAAAGSPMVGLVQWAQSNWP